MLKNTLNLLGTGLCSCILSIADKTCFVKPDKNHWEEKGLVLQTFRYKSPRIMFYWSLPFTRKSTQPEQLSCFDRTIILMVVPGMAGVWCVPGWHPAASPRYPQPPKAAPSRCSWSISIVTGLHPAAKANTNPTTIMLKRRVN